MGNQGSQNVKYEEPLENDIEINWHKVNVSNNSFPGRDGHCSCAVNNKLYVFGGVVHPAAQSNTVTAEINESNEILILDLNTKEWHRPEVHGKLPHVRSSATMASVGSDLYLFGGLSRDQGWFDTVHVFDTETNTWKDVDCEGTGPSPRDKLASCVIENKIYIFGGFGPQGMENEADLEEDDDEDDDEGQDGAQFGWFNDLHILDTATKTWSSPMQMNLGCPSPRAAHGMCALDHYIVVFGGRDAESRRNDLHIFDTVSRKWQTGIVVQGRQPEPRSFHTVTTVGKRVVVLGGRGTADQHFNDFHIFDTEKRQWVQPKIGGTPPSARGVHTATVVGDELVVYGGSGEYSPDILQCTQYYSDGYTVKTDDITSGGAILTDVTSENQENIPSKANTPNISSKTGDVLSASSTGQTLETS